MLIKIRYPNTVTSMVSSSKLDELLSLRNPLLSGSTHLLSGREKILNICIILCSKPSNKLLQLLIIDYIPGSHELKLQKLWISSTASDKPSHCLIHMSVQGPVLRHIPHVQSDTTPQSLHNVRET